MPAGPHYVSMNDDRMRSGPVNKSGEFRLRTDSQLESEIQEYKQLQRSLQQSEIPYAIRIIAEKRLEELTTNMTHGSIDIYQTFIQDLEELKRKHHAKAADYNEEIEAYSREMANIKRARRVLAGAER